MLFALCVPAEAQQAGKVYRIGYLSVVSPAAETSRLTAFRNGLRDLGYVDGKNIVIESRFADGKLDRLGEFSAELVRLKVDDIVTGGTPAGPTMPTYTAAPPFMWTRF
jgi:hypothetical protein